LARMNKESGGRNGGGGREGPNFGLNWLQQRHLETPPASDIKEKIPAERRKGSTHRPRLTKKRAGTAKAKRVPAKMQTFKQSKRIKWGKKKKTPHETQKNAPLTRGECGRKVSGQGGKMTKLDEEKGTGKDWCACLNRQRRTGRRGPERGAANSRKKKEGKKEREKDNCRTKRHETSQRRWCIKHRNKGGKKEGQPPRNKKRRKRKS